MSDDIPVSDNFEPVPGVKYEDEAVETPQEPVKEPETAPETPVNPEPPVEAPKEPEKPAQPEAVVERPKKATPIAKLLETKHTLEETLAQKEARIAELEAQVTKVSE